MAAVLALDLATTSGWALHAPGMERPFFGSFKLPGNPHEHGRAGDALERWLRDMYVSTRPQGGISAFFFEAQHAASHGNVEVIYKLIGLGMIVEKFAYQVKARCWKVHIAEWRKHFIGRGSGFAAHNLDPKELAIQRCGQYGWHTNEPDAAEALGILDYALTMVPDHPRPWRDRGLMGGRG